MDYYLNHSRPPFCSVYNQKYEKQFENIEMKNNLDNIANQKNMKSFRKEILSEKNHQKKYKTTKNSPNKINQNEIIRNNNKIQNEIIMNKMKRIYSKKSNDNRPNSNSLLINHNNINNYIAKKIYMNPNDKKYEKSMINSRLIRNKQVNYINSNFNYNHNLFNYYNNSFEENEIKTNSNNNIFYNYNNINKNGLNHDNQNSSNSMRMLFSKNNDNIFLNKYNKINNYNINNNHNYNFINNENYLENENGINSKRKYQNNCNLVKNSENIMVKNYLNNNNFKFNHNINNNINNNSNEKIIINQIYAHHRVKSNEVINNKIKKISAINYLNKNFTDRKDYPQYAIKYNNNHQINNSGINKINKKINNIFNSGEISKLNSDLSKINKTSRLNPKTNRLENNIYHEINNELNNIDDNLYSNPNRQINKAIKSIEGYINLGNENKIKNKEKDNANNIINKNPYKNSNIHSSLKAKSKHNINNNNYIKNNNSGTKIKINKELINSYIGLNSNKHQNPDNNNAIRSSSINQNTTQFTSTNNNIKNIKKIIKSNSRINNNDNMTNNLSNNISNINSISLSQKNIFITINDKKNATANNFMIKDYKAKDKPKLSINNSINNNLSNNNINNNSTNNIDRGKDIIYQKKLSPKDNQTSFKSIQNNTSISKFENNSNNHNSSTIKSEIIKSRIIKNNIPLTNCRSPTDKKNKKIFNIKDIILNLDKKKDINKIITKNDKNSMRDLEKNNNNKNILNQEKIEEDIKDNLIIENKSDKKKNGNIKIPCSKNESKIENNSYSSYKTNEFENRNMSEFPINDNIIKSKVEEHNNFYMNKNNIMALNKKNIEQYENVIQINADNLNKKEEKNNEDNKSKINIITKESKELFKSIHESDTLIDKDKHLPQLNPKILSNIIGNNNDITNNKIKIKENENSDKNIINKNRENEKDKENNIINKREIKKKEELINKYEIEEKEGIKIELKDEKNIINKIKEDDEKNKNKENIDLNFLENKNIELKNNLIEEEKKIEKLEEEENNNNNESSSKNIEDSLGNKNKRSIYKINKKISSKEKQYDLIKNMYKIDMLCEPINAKNPKKGNNSITNSKNNIFNTTVTKDCEFYQNEQEKLSKYIKSYYKANKKYPKSNLNFYLYGRQIGHGAFGKVNLALHIASGCLVAIKIFAKKNLKNPRAKQKIKNEIEMLSHFNHPFINQILDNFETDTHIFIVMEYVCGDLLGFIRKRGKLSESVSKFIFKQLIEGLKYIHRKKVVHRDIKLDNILIDLTNTIKICDFGVSRYYSNEELMFEHCGTPAYISPEIFESNGYKGTGCDIWSAGVTLYYMLGGVQPFKANTIKDLERIIRKGDFKPLEEVSPEANDLIKGMLQVNPKKRFSIEDILNHPWLDKVDLNQRKKLNLFTEAEKILMSKFDVNYLNSDKSELIENFTIKNIEEEDIDSKKTNGNTKSIIFAPYNSYIETEENNNKIKVTFEEDEIYKEIKIMNDICKFGWRAQQGNIQYELSNNGDFDNGLIKTKKEEDFKKQNEKIEKLFNKTKKNKKSRSSSKEKDYDSEDEIDIIRINKDILDKIEKEIGYDRNYIIDGIKKSKVNYATGTYYLLNRENQYTYQSQTTKNKNI